MPSLQRSSGTAKSTGGASTLNGDAGIITTESLSTAGGASFTLTLSCNAIDTNAVVLVQVANGTNTGGDPTVAQVAPGDRTCTIIIVNRGGSAFNGTLKISFVAFK